MSGWVDGRKAIYSLINQKSKRQSSSEHPPERLAALSSVVPNPSELTVPVDVVVTVVVVDVVVDVVDVIVYVVVDVVVDVFVLIWIFFLMLCDVVDSFDDIFVLFRWLYCCIERYWCCNCC